MLKYIITFSERMWFGKRPFGAIILLKTERGYDFAVVDQENELIYYVFVFWAQL
jgi:hypothetical protein